MYVIAVTSDIHKFDFADQNTHIQIKYCFLYSTFHLTSLIFPSLYLTNCVMRHLISLSRSITLCCADSL